MFEVSKTIGLELEAPDVGSFVRLDRFNRAHDASVITPALGKDGIIWKKIPANLSGLDSMNMGTELVSVDPIKINNKLEDYLKEKFSNLFSFGQRSNTDLSNRAGIHIHITAPVNLRIFKEIISLGAHLEDAFFLLAGMGREYRGIYNNSIYARPITRYGPPIISTSRSYAKCLHIPHLLDSEEVDEFTHKLGEINRQRQRYVPVRYCWLNLVPTIRQGSLEFRVFNLTDNPIYLSAIIILVQAFLENAIKRAYSGNFEQLPVNSVYNYREKGEIIDTMVNFAEGKIPHKYTSILFQIMERTPISGIRLNKNYVFSHLMRHPVRGNNTENHWRNSPFNYRPYYVDEENVREPNFMDSHQATNYSTYLEENLGFINKKPKKIKSKHKKRIDKLGDLESENYYEYRTDRTDRGGDFNYVSEERPRNFRTVSAEQQAEEIIERRRRERAEEIENQQVEEEPSSQEENNSENLNNFYGRWTANNPFTDSESST